MELPPIGFKHWMNQGEIAKFARGMRAYWQRVADVMALALNKHEPLTCPISILHLIAWERNVTPLDRESEALFRLRVHRAFRFTRLAGETAGTKAMFAELDVHSTEIKERFDEIDWDVIDIKVDDKDISESAYLMSALLKLYRRTCRRYQLKTEYETLLYVKPQSFTHRFNQHVASAAITLYPKIKLRAASFTHRFNQHIANI